MYELSYTKPTKKVKGGWKESVLYSFAAASSTDGAIPLGGLLLKGKNLYGVTLKGGIDASNGTAPCSVAAGQGQYGCGIVYELQPGENGWTETVLYNFGATATDAAYPTYMTPVMDSKNNIYGTTESGGGYGVGTVWELAYSPTTQTYTEDVLYSFASQPQDGAQPDWQIVPGKKANTWYGTTANGGSTRFGTIFELTYSKKKGWQETGVWQFFDSNSNDVATPGYNQLIRDKSGNLYGMGWTAGDSGWAGGVFEFQP